MMGDYGTPLQSTGRGTFSDPRDQPFDPANVQWGERESGAAYATRIAAAKATRAAIPARDPVTYQRGADPAERAKAVDTESRAAAAAILTPGYAGPGRIFGSRKGAQALAPAGVKVRRRASTRGGPPGAGYKHLGRFATGKPRREATSYQ